MPPSSLGRGRRRAIAGLVILLSLLAAAIVGAAPKASSQKKKKSKSRSEDATLFPRFLRRMVESDERMVRLDDDDFQDLIVSPKASRPFPVLITFTANAPRFQCGTCQMHLQQVSLAAQSYLQQRKPPMAEQPLVVAMADIDDAPQAFQHMKIETVPHSYVFQANSAQPGQLLGFDMNDPNSLLRAVHDQAGVQILPAPDARLTSLVGVFFAVLVALGAYLAIEHTEWLLSVPRNRQLWLVVSLAVYGFGVGGMVYCIIRSPPPYIWNRDRQVQLFAMHTSQDQYVLEGVVVAALNVLTGLSLAVTVVLASTKRFRLVQYIGVNLSLALSLYLLQRYFLLYEGKVRWYKINETFHQPVSDFLFGSIKKSTGPVRRLLRLSQLWLWDFKDWPAYQKHLNAYLVKYGKREYAALLKRLGLAAASAASKQG